jgi:hypothetical protein
MAAAAIAAISASLWTVGVAWPGQADPVCVPAHVGQRAFCTDVASNPWSICTTTGQENTGCQACKNALASLGDQNLSSWACGWPGTPGFYRDNGGKNIVPPCTVMRLPAVMSSAPSGCDGDMQNDGTILRKNQTVPDPRPALGVAAG